MANNDMCACDTNAMKKTVPISRIIRDSRNYNRHKIDTQFTNKSTIINRNLPFLFSNLVILLIRIIRRIIHGEIINLD